MLRPDTEQVWRLLKRQRWLAGFVLVGGTALALRLRHRVSEDLDFAFQGTKLPGRKLQALVREAGKQGIHFEPNDDPAAMEEFADSPLELRNFQQDFLAVGVKVSFFVPSAPHMAVLRPARGGSGPRVALIGELFQSKCLLSADRAKSRDWLDLHVLMTRCGYTMDDFRKSFEKAGVPGNYEIGINRLCRAAPTASDEGFEHLLERSPSIEELRRFFRARRDEYERRTAARALEKGRRGVS